MGIGRLGGETPLALFLVAFSIAAFDSMSIFTKTISRQIFRLVTQSEDLPRMKSLSLVEFQRLFHCYRVSFNE
jgi:hypothetical protein